ncbi:MAG: MaoC family dehydratase [Proteobacteria bacterium]|nr:MaoC family dehydratase [Pseudomonadota bacterium]
MLTPFPADIVPIERTAEIGTLFEGPIYYMDIKRLWAHSGGPFAAEGWPKKNLHTDPDKAAEAGLPLPIASGQQAQGQLINMLLKLFGQAWWHHGWLKIKFFKPVFAGSQVQSKLKLTEREESAEGVIFTFDAWSERGDGEKALAGTVRCLLPD